MEYRQLGSAGVRVSVLGLGTNRFGSKEVPQSEVDRIIAAALDSGVNFIDTANVYNDGRSEETLGHALKGVTDKDDLSQLCEDRPLVSLVQRSRPRLK